MTLKFSFKRSLSSSKQWLRQRLAESHRMPRPVSSPIFSSRQRFLGRFLQNQYIQLQAKVDEVCNGLWSRLPRPLQRFGQRLQPYCRSTIQGIAIGLLTLYLFFAFLPLPQPIATGLDPAWKYGISRLASEGAVFGKDVIFTYGSLGYLVRGAVVGDNFDTIFVFRLGIHLLLFALTIFKVMRTRDRLMQWAIAISVLFPYLIADFYQALQTEYQILYCILLLLSLDELWRPAVRQRWAIGLGAIAGFLLHTKVSLGLQAAVGLFLFLGAQWGATVWRDRTDLAKLEAATLNWLQSQLAVGTTAFLYLVPGQFDLWLRLLLVVGLSWLLGFALLPRVLRLIPPLSKFDRLAESCFCGVYGLGLIYLTGFTQPSLWAYLQGYREITSGYSSAMSYAGSDAIVGFWGYLRGYFAALGDRLDQLPPELTYGGSALELRLGILILVALLVVVGVTIGWGNLGLGLALLPVVLLTFKHGFVRQGAHVLRFAFTVPLCMALGVNTFPMPIWRVWGLGLHVCALLFCVWSYTYYAHVYPSYYPPTALQVLAPARVAEKVAVLLNPAELAQTLAQQTATNLQGVKLPPEVRSTIGAQSVDVIPWETTIVPANDLNWQPRPIFQSQAAYTTALDLANRDYFQQTPPDFLLYNFQTVDQRHPFFDEPATAFQLWCTYELAPAAPELINLPQLSQVMLLSPRSQGDRCGEIQATQTIQTSWGQQASFAPPDGSVVRAEFYLHYSLWGKLVKMLFRVPPVRLTVWNGLGESQTYRLLPDNADDGVILSPLPLNPEEAKRWFRGILPERTYGFQVSTRYPDLFNPLIEVKLRTYQPQDIVDLRL